MGHALHVAITFVLRFHLVSQSVDFVLVLNHLRSHLRNQFDALGAHFMMSLIELALDVGIFVSGWFGARLATTMSCSRSRAQLSVNHVEFAHTFFLNRILGLSIIEFILQHRLCVEGASIFGCLCTTLPQETINAVQFGLHLGDLILEQIFFRLQGVVFPFKVHDSVVLVGCRLGHTLASTVVRCGFLTIG